MARKVFISFRYSDGHLYKDELVKKFNNDSEEMTREEFLFTGLFKISRINRNLLLRTLFAPTSSVPGFSSPDPPHKRYPPQSGGYCNR